MNRKVRVPDSTEFRERWQRLDREGRRRVRKAVNRGQACERREEAALAVVVGRQQRIAWLVTWPLVSVLVALPSFRQGLLAVLATMLIAATLYAPFALFFLHRARRAAERNREVVEGGGSKKRR